MQFIKPKEITIEDNDGISHTYIISRIPYLIAREIGLQFATSLLPKVGEYKTNEDLARKMMGYVAVHVGDKQMSLSTPQLIDNHIPDLDTGLKLEWEMLNYNIGFFYKGTIYSFFAEVAQKYTAKALEILTKSQESSSQPVEPPSQN